MGFLDGLFGRRSSNEPVEAALSKEDMVQTIRDYSAVLTAGSPPANCVADVSLLPHSKERIKQSLLFGLLITKDEHMQGALVAGYLSLANYQEGVGPHVLGIDVSKVDMTAPIEEQARVIAMQGKEMEKWDPLVAAETAQLTADLKELSIL
jgi:hypothetical protein